MVPDADRRDPVDRLVDAYERMLERVDQALETAEKSAIPSLRKALDNAKEKAVELNELTREEAEKLGHYVERDMKEAARYLADTGDEIREWWRFDLKQIERQLLDMFASVADKTRVELERLAGQAREASLYHTGEVSGPGTLVCVDCGKELHFHKAGRVPPCPKCHGTRFKRGSGASKAG